MVFDAVCQMVNEALSNAVRHAKAQHIHIRCQENATSFTVIVSDDGVGFDVDTAAIQDGLGLRNLQHRAQLHHGAVNIESSAGQGTTVTITIPLHAG
ncbi:MAG: hypothetical protein CUN54_09160 [Phototrophicales bacterium]|nr:MAG: hypothetical protein CUN54_09160 [Phototrophicales bacterium]